MYFFGFFYVFTFASRFRVRSQSRIFSCAALLFTFAFFRRARSMRRALIRIIVIVSGAASGLILRLGRAIAQHNFHERYYRKYDMRSHLYDDAMGRGAASENRSVIFKEGQSHRKNEMRTRRRVRISFCEASTFALVRLGIGD